MSQTQQQLDKSQQTTVRCYTCSNTDNNRTSLTTTLTATTSPDTSRQRRSI